MVSEGEEKVQQKVEINKEWEERGEEQEHKELYSLVKVWEQPQALLSTRQESVDVRWDQLSNIVIED